MGLGWEMGWGGRWVWESLFGVGPSAAVERRRRRRRRRRRVMRLAMLVLHQLLMLQPVEAARGRRRRRQAAQTPVRVEGAPLVAAVVRLGRGGVGSTQRQGPTAARDARTDDLDKTVNTR